jgi:hypothetical protein
MCAWTLTFAVPCSCRYKTVIQFPHCHVAYPSPLIHNHFTQVSLQPISSPPSRNLYPDMGNDSRASNPRNSNSLQAQNNSATQLLRLRFQHRCRRAAKSALISFTSRPSLIWPFRTALRSIQNSDMSGWTLTLTWCRSEARISII